MHIVFVDTVSKTVSKTVSPPPPPPPPAWCKRLVHKCDQTFGANNRGQIGLQGPCRKINGNTIEANRHTDKHRDRDRDRYIYIYIYICVIKNNKKTKRKQNTRNLIKVHQNHRGGYGLEAF